MSSEVHAGRDKLHHRLELGVLHEAVLDDVLDRLNVVVMVRSTFTSAASAGEVGEEILEELVGVVGEGGTSTISMEAAGSQRTSTMTRAWTSAYSEKHARRIFTLEP